MKANIERFKEDRKKLDIISKKLILLIAKRNNLSSEILTVKKKLGMKDTDLKREKELAINIKKIASEHNVDSGLASRVLTELIKEGKRFRKIKPRRILQQEPEQKSRL